MRFLIFMVVLGLTVFACGSESPKTNNTSAPKKKKKAKKPVDGEKVYKQYCLTCHGADGTMGASGALDLSVTKLTLEEKIEVITNGRNTMTPFKGLLNEAKIKAVAEYTEKLKK